MQSWTSLTALSIVFGFAAPRLPSPRGSAEAAETENMSCPSWCDCVLWLSSLAGFGSFWVN